MTERLSLPLALLAGLTLALLALRAVVVAIGIEWAILRAREPGIQAYRLPTIRQLLVRLFLRTFAGTWMTADELVEVKMAHPSWASVLAAPPPPPAPFLSSEAYPAPPLPIYPTHRVLQYVGHASAYYAALLCPTMGEFDFVALRDRKETAWEALSERERDAAEGLLAPYEAYALSIRTAEEMLTVTGAEALLTPIPPPPSEDVSPVVREGSPSP